MALVRESKMKWMSALVAIILLSGCLGLEDKGEEEMSCTAGDIYSYEWMDSFQWNSAPMSYGNATVWDLNTTAMNTLEVNLTVMAWFSEQVGPIEQGFLNVSILQNDTVLWENQTSNNTYWNLTIPVNNTEELWIEIQASGKDTHPESEMGDYFVLDVAGRMQQPETCE
jgi:hypothetical protein|tara:strand:+ start:305 stop:811 length:507 start_codon:yes stop_codon:yes gene_type:complete